MSDVGVLVAAGLVLWSVGVILLAVLAVRTFAPRPSARTRTDVRGRHRKDVRGHPADMRNPRVRT